MLPHMDQNETTEARLEALESLVRRALSGGGADAPLLGDVTGPESATVLSKIGALAALGADTFVAVDNAGLVKAAQIQRGTAAIVANGFVNVPAIITANSRIYITCEDMNPNGGATVEFDTPAAFRVIGSPGSFRIRACINTGATQVLDTSTFNWCVID
jgi:hypothetical protein